ncbi:MAG: response regulator transcription factor [Chloroflexota bacterium]
MNTKILVIDDDPDFGRILKLTLEQAGYQVALATSGAEGLEKCHQCTHHLVLLDVMMPGLDGWDVCRQLRQTLDVPIIMITVLNKEAEIVKGLNLGADDYITKPWSNLELLSRIRAVLRRVKTSTCIGDTYSDESLSICPATGQVLRDGQSIQLTHIERRLLFYLARRPGQIVSHSELLSQVWGSELKQDINCLRWHIHNLRQKLEDDPHNPQYIVAQHGMGYCLVLPGQ